MIKGSCLCGRVTYEYAGEIEELAMCHCGQCKQAQGTPFATNAILESGAMTWLSGEDQLRDYFSSENKRRVFCGNCGSPLFSERTDLPGQIRLRAGTITEGGIPRPSYQIFCESASTWLPQDERIPAYPGAKP